MDDVIQCRPAPCNRCRRARPMHPAACGPGPWDNQRRSIEVHAMTAQVILKATEGALRGMEYVFTGRARCTVGRGPDCSVRLPRDDLTVSRRHCLLEIDAPAATVRDLGSTNGTYVNGQRVGRPGGRAGADAGAPDRAAPRPLWCGDELQVGDTAFRVLVVTAEEVDSADYTGG